MGIATNLYRVIRVYKGSPFKGPYEGTMELASETPETTAQVNLSVGAYRTEDARGRV